MPRTLRLFISQQQDVALGLECSEIRNETVVDLRTALFAISWRIALKS
jgi:hypothetical protein